MNSIDPTSSPRVGWATTRSFTSPVSSRAMMTFCWLPPDRVATGTSGLGARTSNSRDELVGVAPDGGLVAQAAAGEGPVLVAVEHEVVGDAERPDHPVLAAVLGHVADAELDDLPGGRVGDVLAADRPRRPTASVACP